MRNRIYIKKMPLKKWQIIMEVFNVFIILLMFLFIASVWSNLPDKIPTHFTFTGKIDAWGSRSQVFFLPFMALALYLIFTVCSRFPRFWNVPRKITEENKEYVFQNMSYMLSTIKTAVLILLFYIQLCTLLLLSFSPWIGIPIVILLFFPSIFFSIRIYLPQKK